MTLLDLNLKEAKWPQLDDKLFGDENPYDWMNACLNILGREEKYFIYASGYREAAELVFQNLDSGARHHDILVYPIVFLFRQSIELLLKDIIMTCYKIVPVKHGYPKHHSLEKLWNEAKASLVKIQIDLKGDDVLAFENLLMEFENVDPFSSAFRYPEDKNKNESLPGLDKLNLTNFMSAATKMYEFLNGLDVLSSEYWEDIKGSV